MPVSPINFLEKSERYSFSEKSESRFGSQDMKMGDSDPCRLGILSVEKEVNGQLGVNLYCRR